MDQALHETSAVKTWVLILLMVGWVAFKGWLAYTVIGNLGPPDWDYRPILDVPGESAYAINNPYHPLPYAQHVKGGLGQEENPSQMRIIPFQGVE